MTTAMGSDSSVYSHRDPSTAARLSLMPGLGQLYNGETRKGLLFLIVAAINFVAFTCMIFAKQILGGLKAFGESFHMTPNKVLGETLLHGHFGSVVSFIFLAFFVTFVVYAIRDAYDHAALKRRRIYPDFVLQLPEATSGSYIVHTSVMVALAFLCFFFILPPPPSKQIVDIEFLPEQTKSAVRPETLKIAPTNSQRSGRRVKDRPVAAAQREVAKADPAKAPQQQTKPVQRPAEQTPATQSAKPTTQPAKPTEPVAPKPVPSIPMPTLPNLFSNPKPKMAMATPTAAAPMPQVSAAHLPTPNMMPMPSAAAPKVSGAAGLPGLVPTAMPKGGPGGPAPNPLARPGSGSQGLPSIAPGPTAFTGTTSGPPGSTYAPRTAIVPGGGGFRAPGPVGPVIGGGITPGGKVGPTPTAGPPGGGKTDSKGKDHGGAPAPVYARGPATGPSGTTPFAVAPSVGRPGNSDDDKPDDPRPSKPATAAEPNFGPYMAELQRRIKRAWFPPKGPASKRVVVVFKIHTRGEMSHLRIEQSSGNSDTDNAALKAVENAAPFAHLPANSPDDVDIQFTFDYNVFGGASGKFRQF